MNLLAYGWDDKWQAAFATCGNADSLPARVTTMYADRYEVVTEENIVKAHISGRMRYDNLYSAKNPTVGDWVALQPNPHGAATIIDVLPRVNCLERQGVFGSVEAQVIAANIDKCLLLQALGRDFNPSRLDRYVTMVWNTGITPVVLLTKADTVPIEEVTKNVKLLAGYLSGVDVLAISALTGYGIDKLLSLLAT